MTSAAYNSRRDYAEISAAFVIVAALLLALARFDLLPTQFGVADTMSYALIFVIGLVASVSSCMAVTGGLLVAVAARYNEVSGGLTSAQRMKPHLYFNAGRIVSYTVLGGAVGALGSALTLSPEINGLLTIAASALMILLGLQMLNLLPSLTRLLPTMPKSFGHFIHDLAERDANGGAFVLGAATFFLPCGFTQALQLYVLAKGDVTVGALTMLAFSLGTLPALLSLSALSSFATGRLQRYFLRFAGAAVIVLGIANIQYGLVLTGTATGSAPVAASIGSDDAATVSKDEAGSSEQNSAATDTAAARETAVEIIDGKQIAVMRIEGFDYIPNHFTVRRGMPVEWRIDASEAAGCGRILLAPRLGVRKLLSDRTTTMISFTPKEAGEFGFNCGMGMMTPGSKFIVVPNTSG